MSIARKKFYIVCVAIGVLSGLLYYAYLTALTPVLNEIAEEGISAAEKVLSQQTTITSSCVIDETTTVSTSGQ